jgi:hypothetical protein
MEGDRQEAEAYQHSICTICIESAQLSSAEHWYGTTYEPYTATSQGQPGSKRSGSPGDPMRMIDCLTGRTIEECTKEHHRDPWLYHPERWTVAHIQSTRDTL